MDAWSCREDRGAARGGGHEADNVGEGEGVDCHQLPPLVHCSQRGILVKGLNGASSIMAAGAATGRQGRVGVRPLRHVDGSHPGATRGPWEEEFLAMVA